MRIKATWKEYTFQDGAKSIMRGDHAYALDRKVLIHGEVISVRDVKVIFEPKTEEGMKWKWN